MSAVRAMYDLFVSYEQDLPDEYRFFNIHLQSMAYVENVLRVIREARLFREQWCISVIDLKDL